MYYVYTSEHNIKFTFNCKKFLFFTKFPPITLFSVLTFKIDIT